MLLFLTICFVTPSLSNVCLKIISLRFFELGWTSLPPIWTMSFKYCFLGYPLASQFVKLYTICCIIFAFDNSLCAIWFMQFIFFISLVNLKFTFCILLCAICFKQFFLKIIQKNGNCKSIKPKWFKKCLKCKSLKNNWFPWIMSFGVLNDWFCGIYGNTVLV